MGVLQHLVLVLSGTLFNRSDFPLRLQEHSGYVWYVR